MSALERRDRWLMALAGRLVPAGQRESWQREWEGELGALAQRSAAWPGPGRRRLRSAVRVALRDALWLRFHPQRADAQGRPLRQASLSLHAPLDEPGQSAVDALARDLLFGLRRLRRSPGYALSAIAFLATAIAATTTVFVLLHAIVLRPLPYSAADRLLRVVGFDIGEGQEDWLSLAEYEALRTGGTTFEAVAYSTVFPAMWERQGGRARLQRAFVSPSYFGMLGARAHRGRFLTEAIEDDASIVVSHAFWRRHGPSGDAALGRPLTLDGETYTIVGVAGPDMYTHELAGLEADVWLIWPRARPMDDLDFRIFTGVARVAEGRSIEEARAEVGQLASVLADENQAVYGGWRMAVAPLRDTVVGTSRRSLLLTFGALGLLMLGMCANLANLVLVRLLGRRGELAIHRALGGRRRIVARQLAIESAILAAASGLAGCGLASLAIRHLPAWLPFDLPRLAEVKLDPQSVGFALMLTVVAAGLSGILPAWIGARGALATDLRANGRRSTRRVGWLRSGSIVAQIAVALPLLVAAGLLVRSLLHLREVDLGLRPSGVVAARVSVGFDQYPEPADRAALFASLLDGLRARPGVEAAGALLQAPLVADQQDRTRFAIGGLPLALEHEKPRALLQIVAPGSFDALGTRLLAGRDFDATDRLAAAPVALVSASLVARHFSGLDPLGRTITSEVNIAGEAATRTVIGVVEDMAHLGPTSPPEPMIYLPHAQVSWPSMAVVVRTAGPLELAVRALRSEVIDHDPTAVIETAHGLSDALRDQLATPRAAAALLAAFAAVATALSLLGLYGLLSYDVAQAEHEVAIRMAIGATGGAIRRRLLARSAGLLAAGLAIGLVLAAVAARGLRAVVFGLPGFDVVSFALAAVTLLAVAFAVSLLPAARASRTSPATALRGG